MNTNLERRLQALEGNKPGQEWENVFVYHEGDPVPDHNPDSDFLISIGSTDPFPTMKGHSPFRSPLKRLRHDIDTNTREYREPYDEGAA